MANTKRALLTSVLAIVACVAMLIGSTFAWFTDTAGTAVNKITSGTLHVEIQNKEGKPIDTLEWVKENGTAIEKQDDILWEPGCTYLLTPFKIVNTGTLALKYKIVITGLDSGSPLLDVIKFTYKTAAGETFDMNAEGHLTAKGTDGASTDVITISAHMDENAGNDYQGKTLEGVKFTVYATQDTVESDSFDNQYDKDAKYTEVIAAGKAFSSGKHTLYAGITATNANAIAVKASGANTDVTILDGTFDGGSGGNNQCIHVRDGATVTIKGGTFTVGGDANGEGNSVIESNGGNIIIEGGFFQTDHHWRGFYYVLNQQNNNPGTITVKGGTFVNYDPSKGDDNLGGNFVPDGYTVVTEKKANGDVWYTVVSKSDADGLKDVLAKGGELTVSDEIRIDKVEDTADARVTITKPTTLNLDAKIVTPDNMGNNDSNFCALIVDADTTINAGENGGIDTGKNGGYGINVRKGATLTINGGSYYGGGTAVQVQKGTLTINGGHFAVEAFGEPYGYNFLLNCIDSAYKDGSAKIIVKGGTFVNFDPSNNTAEGAGTNFVADGYKVTSATQANGDVWYTVVVAE